MYAAHCYGGVGAGEKIPSVRVLAAQFGVNPNTVQKSLSVLDERGLLVSPSTAGRFVTENVELVAQSLEGIARMYVEEFAERMQSLGVTSKQAREYLSDFWDAGAVENAN
ncbi:GntR family transcriptional regulator [Arcanobacterium hippocoleae]|uniref:GntR family transcriptional regulator n=1 Tax=Arcanobacterium hippocoleae TaxID=149017 RepID=UPI003342C6BF